MYCKYWLVYQMFTSLTVCCIWNTNTNYCIVHNMLSCLPECPFPAYRLSVYVSLVCLCCMCICLSVCLSVDFPSAWLVPAFPLAYLHICLSFFLSVCLPLCLLSVCLSFWFSVCLCLSNYLSVTFVSIFHSACLFASSSQYAIMYVPFGSPTVPFFRFWPYLTDFCWYKL